METFEISHPFSEAAFMFSPGCRSAKTAQLWVLPPPARAEDCHSFKVRRRNHNKHPFPVSHSWSKVIEIKTKHNAQTETFSNQSKEDTVERRGRYTRIIGRYCELEAIHINATNTVNIEIRCIVQKEASTSGNVIIIRFFGKPAVFTVFTNLLEE
jgi:hypothetical protein